MNELYMEKALKEAKKAYVIDDVPVGCIIVKNNKIIASGFNQKEKKQNAIKHAEIIAIEKACKKLKTWHLDDCTMYVTMEPCLMCTGAIIQSRISNIYYSVSNEVYGSLKKNKLSNMNIYEGILREKSEMMLKEFFQQKRK